MRILLATFWNFPLSGGVSAYLVNLKQGLEEMGHRVDIFGQQGGWESHYVLNDRPLLPKRTVKKVIMVNISHYFNQHFPTLPQRIKQLEIDRYSFELAAAYIDLARYDIIHCQDVIASWAFSRIRPATVPLVVTVHGCLTFEFVHAGIVTHKRGLSWNYYVEQEKLGITAADNTLVPTHWLRHLMSKEFHLPMGRMTVIPYGINTDDLLDRMLLSTDLGVAKNHYVIVCPARLDPIKGHTVLFEALVKLKQKRKDWVCLLLGDGFIRKKLESICEQVGLTGHVRFLGHRPDVPAILKKADVMVLPSLQDNQPFAVMEAQIAGKPVIVSDTGGLPEMVRNGATGLLFKSGNSDALFQKLAILLENGALRNRLGTNGKRQALTQWSLNKMLERTLNVYTSV